MQVGVITVDGATIGSITQGDSAYDSFVPNLEGYFPEGRASEKPLGFGSDGPASGHPEKHGRSKEHSPGPGHRSLGHEPESHGAKVPGPHGDTKPEGKEFTPSARSAPFHQGSAETDQAIVDAARAHDLDPNFMRGVASIESGMNPASNAHRPTQYKGLYQIGRSEWDRFGNGGNIYSAKENAMGAARMFSANRDQFRKRYGRDPTDTEYYMMHQQGLGFYTRGAMTNIKGNPYPGMSGPQTHDTFEAGWGRELARRKAGFTKTPPIAATQPMPPVQGLEDGT
jgi:hypothetical protein